MAEMYRKLSIYTSMENEDEFTADEIFMRDDTYGLTAVASLPVVGSTGFTDYYGSASTVCICRSKRGEFESKDPNSIKWTFHYSTSKNPPPAQNTETDPAARRYDMGCEVISGKLPNGISEVAGATVRFFSYRVPSGSFMVPTKSAMAVSAKKSFITAMEGIMGKVNSAAFEGHAIGNVLCEGFSGGTKYVNGIKKYQFEIKFSVKSIPDIADHCWNYVLTETGVWDKVKVNGNAVKYNEADFAAVLASYCTFE